MQLMHADNYTLVKAEEYELMLIDYYQRCNGAKEDVAERIHNTDEYIYMITKKKYNDIFSLVKKNRFVREFIVCVFDALSCRGVYGAYIDYKQLKLTIDKLFSNDIMEDSPENISDMKEIIKYIREFYTKCRLHKMDRLRPLIC